MHNAVPDTTSDTAQVTGSKTSRGIEQSAVPDASQGAAKHSHSGWSRLLHPRLVLLVAIVLPGVGQVINRQPMRGLMMVFFMLVMAVVCYHLTTPEHSVLGRYAGGWFIYALSIMDAYQFSRRRWELMRHASN